MGELLKFKCKKCSLNFSWREGGGFNFDMLHCNDCGKEKEVKTNNNPEIKITPLKECKYCGGGGRFIPDAPIRCPKCREIHDLIDGRVEVLYD